MSCVGFYIHRGDSGEQWYLKIESTGGLLEKVLMCELPTGDGRKETRCIETQALQLIHCHRRPPRGIADYHHLRPIPRKLLQCQNGAGVRLLAVVKDAELVQEPGLKAAGLGDGSDPGHPLEYRRRRRGGHFLRPGAARTWVDEAEDGLDATKTDVSVCWGVSQSHATQLDAASNTELHPASARLDSRRPANVRPSPVIFPASASTTNQRIHAQEF